MSTAASLSGNSLTVEHQVDTLGIQTFGFWIYIMTDLVLFTALFATYGVFRHRYAGGPSGLELFNIQYAFIETMLLLVSSATCGFAMINMQNRKNSQVVLWLVITLLLGLGFIGMEVSEFRHLILKGYGPNRSAFLSSFFTLVSTHGLHVSVGLIWIAVMVIQLFTKGLTESVQSRLIRMSIFWHFLDIVWVGVFTMVYLLGALT